MNNYILLERVIGYHNGKPIFNDMEIKEIYDKYKGYLLSNRKGVYQLYSNCIVMRKYVEYPYIRNLADKIANKTVKNGSEISIDKFIGDLDKFNLTEDERETIEARLIMAKIAS